MSILKAWRIPRPEPAAVQLRPLRILTRNVGTTGPAVVISTRITVPDSEMWEITHIVASAIPVATTSVVSNRVMVQFPGLSAPIAFDVTRCKQQTGNNSLSVANGAVFTAEFEGSFFLPAGYQIFHEVQMVAADAANRIELSLTGFVVPPEFWPASQSR